MDAINKDLRMQTVFLSDSGVLCRMAKLLGLEDLATELSTLSTRIKVVKHINIFCQLLLELKF